jgi:asparagine synthase (glutamine-hydrolysing)
MCGIVGFNWEDKALLRRMSEQITHRGPDDNVIFADSGISLGMRRLSIIDLKKDIYPMTNENQDIFLVFNGEIYNFQELRKELEEKGHRFKTNCDAEVIVHCYEEYPDNFLQKFNGMFAIALYDLKNKKLILARDRVGIKPLYYNYQQGHLVFASEIKSILQLGTINREMNLQALNNYFALRYNPSYQTLFKGIKKLQPGHKLELDLKTKEIDITKYWDINLLREEKKSSKQWQKEILNLMESSVKLRMISDVPIGAFLSGGIDSSAIVAMMSKIKKENNDDSPIKTYSVSFEKGQGVNEDKYAKQVAEHFGADHNAFQVNPDIAKILPKIIHHTDEPMADPALLPVYMLSEEAKKSSTVILTGDGGDELFGGYDHHRILKAVNFASKIPLFNTLGPTAIKSIPLSIWNKVYKHAENIGDSAYVRAVQVVKEHKNNKAKAYYELLGMFDEKERKQLLKEHYKEIDYNKINNLYFKNTKDYVKRLLYYDFKRLLAEGYMMKTDRITMARHIEARVPFLDHRMAELAFKIPSKEKIKGFKETKYILKKSLEGVLPKNIIYRKKQSFHMPIENWLDKDLKPVVDDVLNTTKIFRQGILDHNMVKKLKDNYAKGKLYYARQIWTLLNFEIWHKMFIEKEKVKL